MITVDEFKYGDRVFIPKLGHVGVVAYAGPGYVRVHLDGASSQRTWPFNNEDVQHE